MIISISLLLADYPRMAYWILFWKRTSRGWSLRKPSFLNAFLFYRVQFVQCYGCISSTSKCCLH